MFVGLWGVPEPEILAGQDFLDLFDAGCKTFIMGAGRIDEFKALDSTRMAQSSIMASLALGAPNFSPLDSGEVCADLCLDNDEWREKKWCNVSGGHDCRVHALDLGEYRASQFLDDEDIEPLVDRWLMGGDLKSRHFHVDSPTAVSPWEQFINGISGESIDGIETRLGITLPDKVFNTSAWDNFRFDTQILTIVDTMVQYAPDVSGLIAYHYSAMKFYRTDMYGYSYEDKLRFQMVENYVKMRNYLLDLETPLDFYVTPQFHPQRWYRNIISETVMSEDSTKTEELNLSGSPSPVDTSTDTITTTNTFESGDWVQFFPDTGATLPSPLVAEQLYYAYKVDDTHIKVAEKWKDAIAGTNCVNLTTSGSGTVELFGSGQNERCQARACWYPDGQIAIMNFYTALASCPKGIFFFSRVGVDDAMEDAFDESLGDNFNFPAGTERLLAMKQIMMETKPLVARIGAATSENLNTLSDLGGVPLHKEAINLSTAVDTTNDKITVSKVYTNGAAVRFYGDYTVTMPGGLTEDTTHSGEAEYSAKTVYYAIYVDDTHIKLATTLGNAILGTAIDLTSTGSGTAYLELIEIFGIRARLLAASNPTVGKHDVYMIFKATDASKRQYNIRFHPSKWKAPYEVEDLIDLSSYGANPLIYQFNPMTGADGPLTATSTVYVQDCKPLVLLVAAAGGSPWATASELATAYILSSTNQTKYLDYLEQRHDQLVENLTWLGADVDGLSGWISSPSTVSDFLTNIDTMDKHKKDAWEARTGVPTYFDSGGIKDIRTTPTAGGSGYVVNDVLTAVQTGASGGQVKVGSVDGSGAVLTLSFDPDNDIGEKGTGYKIGPITFTGGTGSGCTTNIKDVWSMNGNSMTCEFEGSPLVNLPWNYYYRWNV